MSDTNVHRVVGNLLVGTSHFFVDTTTNQVGVNTSTPGAALDVQGGDVKVGSGITLASSTGTITATGFSGNGSGLSGVNSDSGSWVNGSSSNIHLAVSTDNVGIGIDNPGHKLDVNGDINIATGSTLRVGGTPAVFSNWSVHTNGSDIYRSSGNVGIGTTDPVTPFELVVGTSAAPLTAETTIMQLNSTLDGSSSDHKCYFKFQYVPESNPVSWTDWSGRIQFVTDSTNQGYIEFNPPGAEYAIAFGNTGGGSAAGEIMRLLGTGNVGIGTTSPGHKLEVNGTVRASTYVSTPYLYRSSHNSGYMVGSYNSVGANSTMVNPIYTIGSNYMPTGDNAIGNMYGIGYSHGNFTSLLTGGWGMYVASDGDVRIGLNAQHGHIKCTGYVDAGTEVYAQNWFRSRGNSGHHWESTSNGNGWHIYPKDRQDMYFRTGLFNGGIAGTVHTATVRGYIHWTTSNEIGFLNSIRHWSLRMDDAKNCSVYGNNYSYAYHGHSDTRMKKNIVHADDTTALNLIREIKPRIYEYIDTPRRGTHSVYGFIAQEIKELMPKAVKVREGEIPNIYQNATFDKEQMIITFENFDTGNLHQTKDIICRVDNGEVEKHLSIKSVLNSKQLEIEDDDEFKALLEESEIADEIFVWGQTVDDFHSIDKNYIFTVATAALQEVDRQLQTTKEDLQTTKTELKADLQTTQTELAEERTLHETTRTQLRNTQTELDVAKIKLLNIEARMQIIESNISKVVV